MCGRNSLFIDQPDLEARFEAGVVADGGYTPRYNIAPGDDLHIITNEASDEIDAYHWGLIPFWADEPKEGIINARSETADEKRVFFRTSGDKHSRLVEISF
jgi:putative SOS response-associated peptidase YedK